MVRAFIIAFFIFVSSASSSFAGFSSYKNPYNNDSVIAPVQIKDNGLYNLVISIQFLNEPYERKPYESDEYKKFIRRLSVEWSGVALLKVLQAQEQSLNDLATLKSIIEKEVEILADKLKPKYSLDRKTEVVFALSNFFLIKPENNGN